MPGLRNIHNGWVRASAGGLSTLCKSLHQTKVPAESTNPGTLSTLKNKNVFDVSQDPSEVIQ